MRTAAIAGDAFAGLPDAQRRILDAAIEAFADRGFHATTTRDIALAAGLSPAGLYVHYPSKAAVLGQVSVLGHRAALALTESELGSGAGASDRLAGAGRAGGSGASDAAGRPGAAVRLQRFSATFAAWHARHHTVARVVQYELAALTGEDRVEVTSIRRAIESLVEGEVRRGVADGVLAVDDPHGVTRAVLSLCIDVARWYDPAGRESPEDVARLYGRLALRMLGARAHDETTEGA